jgi:hypothetical protein
MRRRVLYFGLPSLIVAAMLFALAEPNRVIPGLLAGEPFHRWRPARFWKDVLRSDGAAGVVRQQTAKDLQLPVDSSVAVLKACLCDPDPHVRWPAAVLMGNSLFANNVVPSLRDATRDEDAEVRLSALLSLQGFGANARAAVPELIERFHDDPELQARFYAERALWHVSPEDARREGGWRIVASKTWNFSADFPAEPTESDITIESPWGPTVSRAFNAGHEVTRCVVVVTDYPADMLKTTSTEQLLDAIGNAVPGYFPGGKLVKSRDIELDGHKAREHLIQADGLGMTWNRVFFFGSRKYAIFVAYNPKFLIKPAAEHFLNSLHVGPTP